LALSSSRLSLEISLAVVAAELTRGDKGVKFRKYIFGSVTHLAVLVFVLLVLVGATLFKIPRLRCFKSDRD